MKLNQINYNPQKEKHPRSAGVILGAKRVTLEPGRNLISDESLVSIEGLPDFVEGLKRGVFEIVSKVESKTPEEVSNEGLMLGDKLIDLSSVNATEAKTMASDETDPLVLERWLTAEQARNPVRKTVVFELETKLESIQGK